MEKIELPWYPPELHPNPPSHWRAKMKAKKSYRERCHWIGKLQKHDLPAGKIHAIIIFHPKTKAGDLDNMLSGAKNGIDGLCLGLGINDKRLRPITIDVGECRNPPVISIELTLPPTT